MVQKGKIIALDTLARLIESHTTQTYAVSGERSFPILNDLRAYPGTRYCFAFGREHHLVLEPYAGGPEAAREYLEGLGHEGVSIRPIEPNIEDVFIDLTQEKTHG